MTEANITPIESLEQLALEADAAVERAVHDWRARNGRELWGWRIPAPRREGRYTALGLRRWRGTQYARALRDYPALAVSFAASRIAEAYGLGAGHEWARAYGFAAAGADTRAAAQTMDSLGAVEAAR